MPKIKDIPKVDRPREKFLKKGPDALSKSELLAVLIGSGIKGKNVKKLSEQIIRKFGSKFLDLTVDDLLKISGIGQAKALQIISAIALVKRIYDEKEPKDNIILSAKDAVSLTSEIRDKKKEHLVCLYLNARNALLKKEIISIGILDKSIIHPREIFGPAVELRAAGIILLHNHPSGDTSPSPQDEEVINKIVEAGKIMGVNTIDFIIVSAKDTYSVFANTQQAKIKTAHYISDGIQNSLFDLLVDRKMEYNPQISKTVKKANKSNNDTGNKITFIDLFAGIGGIRIGFENAGLKCVFGSEINKECQLTYRLNFNEFPHGDITKINAEIIPNHNVLIAGFPCQSFSICGKQRGFEDTRGTLFFDILRIAKAKKPDVIFLENVKHLKYHNKKKTLSTIVSNLEQIGYKISWEILNAKDFGVAQNRERIIIIGHKKKRFDFSKLKKKEPLLLKDILENDGVFEYLKPNEYTLLKNTKRQDSGLIFAGYRNKKIRTNGTRFNTKHLSRVHKQPNRIYSSWGIHPTLPSQESSGRFFVLHNNRVRKLNVDECFKLMGFPKGFKKYSVNGNLYKQIGNSVAVPMIKEIAHQIKSQFFIR